MTKKPPRTADEYYPELGRELIQMLVDRLVVKVKGKPKIENYTKLKSGHRLQNDELWKLFDYISWSMRPRRRGPRELLYSEKLTRMRADHDEFEREKAKFKAAKEKAPRKKAIQSLMEKWNVNDETTVEKRIAKWRKTPEAYGGDLLIERGRGRLSVYKFISPRRQR
jgi:hypothetical protein